MIEEPEVVVHEAHEPDVFADLAYADCLIGKYSTEIDFALADADAAAGVFQKPKKSP